MGDTLHCYDNCFQIYSALFSLVKYVEELLDIKTTFSQISWKSENRKGNFKDNPQTFGINLDML